VTGRAAVVFDLGGSRIKAGVVEADSGKLVAFQTAIVNGDFEGALSAIKRLGRELSDGIDPAGTGLCVPGIVDERGIVISLPGKLDGVEGYDLPGFLSAELVPPAIVVNDAVAYAVGESAFGEGRGMMRVVVMTIGTGVGVTVVEDGRPLGSGTFGAGIFGGQIPISERLEGPEDTSGRSDTIEALCRARRIVDYASDAGGEFESVEEVYAAHRKGDGPAADGIRTYRAHLVRAIVALTHAHAPEAIVIGGGPMVDGNPIIEGIEDEVNERLFGSLEVRVRRAALGDSGALVGLGCLLGRESGV